MGSRSSDRQGLLRDKLRLQKILDAAAPLFQIDKSQKVIYVNKAFTSLMGLTKKDVIGQKCHDIWNCSFCHTDTCALMQILRKRNLSQYKFSKRYGGKNNLICDIIAVPFQDSWGKIDTIVQSVINISEISDHHRIKTALLDNSLDLSLVISTEGKILSISESCAQALGKAPEDLLEKDFWTCFPENLNGVQRQHLDEALRFSTPVRFERSRGDRWFEYCIYPLPDNGGGISRIAVLSKDITDRKIAQLRLKEAYDKLKMERQALGEKNIALRQMITVVDEERQNIGRTIKSNLDKCVLPCLSKLEQSVPEKDLLFLRQLRESLNNLLSPFISNLENSYQKLTPRELEICRLINQNLTSKEIASTLNTSESTVKNQRKSIRKKLQISGKKINLTSALSQIQSG